MPDDRMRYSIEYDDSQAIRAQQRVIRGNQQMGASGEAAARSASRGFDKMNESMTGAVLKGSIIADALGRATSAILDFLKESASAAMRVDTLTVAMEHLARVNGWEVQSTRQIVQTMQEMHIARSEALNMVNQMIGAHMDLTKATKLAQLAQNAAVVSGVTSSQAMQAVISGVASQQVEVLRNMGIMVNFEQALVAARREARRELTQTERANVLLNATLTAGAALEGVRAAALSTTQKKFSSLKTEMELLKEEIGRAFTPALNLAVDSLTKMAVWAENNIGLLEKLGKIAGIAALSVAIAKIPGALAAAATAATSFLGVFNLAGSAASVGGLAATFMTLKTAVGAALPALGAFAAVLAGGVVANQILTFKTRMEEAADAATKTGKEFLSWEGGVEGLSNEFKKLNEQIDITIASGNKLADIKVPGLAVDAKTIAQFRNTMQERMGLNQADLNFGVKVHVEGLVEMPASALDKTRRKMVADFDKRFPKEITLPTPLKIQRMIELKPMDEQEAAKFSDAVAKHQTQILLQTRQQALEAYAETSDKAGQIRAKAEVELAKLAQMPYERMGRMEMHKVAVPAEAVRAVESAIFSKMLAEQLDRYRKHLEDRRNMAVESAIQEFETYRDYQEKMGEARMTLGQQAADRTEELNRAMIESDLSGVADEKAAQLRALEAVDAQTIQQKLIVEDKKLAIEQDASRKSAEITKRRIEYEKELSLEKLSRETPIQLIGTPEYLEAQRQIERVYGQQITEAQDKALEEQTARQQEAEIERTKMIRDNNRSVFDSLKNEAGTMFDALTQQSKSFWSTFANIFKTAILTAIKDVVSSEIAKGLMSMLYGVKTSGSQGGGYHFEGSAAAGGGIMGLFRGMMQTAEKRSQTGAPGPAISPPIEEAAPAPPPEGQSISQLSPGGFPILLGKDNEAMLLAASGLEPGALAGGQRSGFQPEAPQQPEMPLAGHNPVLDALFGSGGTRPLGVAGGGAPTVGGGIIGALMGMGAVGGFHLPGVARPGAPGGTPGFAGPVAIAMGAAGGQRQGQSGGLGGLFGGGLTGGQWAERLSSLRDFAGVGKSISTGAGSATTWSAASMGERLSSIGKSSAALMGGAMLAMNGLQRGGALGMVETAAGGAMIGYKYGGPLGAAIGGGIGALAGGLRWLIGGKKPRDRMYDAVKSAYGIDVKDRNLLDSWAKLAQEKYAGNYNMCARGPEVREQIQLYQESVGGKPIMDINKIHPTELTQRNGVVSQQAFFQNGAAYAFESALPTIGARSVGKMPVAGTMPSWSTTEQGLSVNLTLSPNQTLQVFQGQTVQTISQNPRAVAAATQQAYSGNYNRRDSLATAWQPGLVLR